MFLGDFNDTQAFAAENYTGYVNGRLRAAFWGFLYNKEASGAGDTANDAETLSRLYEKKGIGGFAAMDGSFTFIIREGGKTVIARDHHGTGPQVYYTGNGFASSLGELLRSRECPKEVDGEALALFMGSGYIPAGRSAFRGIKKLEAGSALVFDKGKITVTRLFDTSGIEPVPMPGNPTEALETFSERYGELHARSIRRRIGDCRNVGILLSGGYDSGCNLAALRQQYDGTIRSYSVGFKGDGWSELPLARCMADAFGTEHRQYEIDGSEIAALPEIVQAMGDPFVEGGLMVNYAAMRMIGEKKADIILGGDGSDQYFGTSGREVAIRYLAGRYGMKPLLTLACKTLDNDMLSRYDKAYRLRFHLDKILHVMEGDRFGFDPRELKKLLRQPQWTTQPETIEADTRSFGHLYTQHAYRTDIEKTIDQVILFKASRMAALFGNRMAFPYMDLELYGFLQKLPVGFKCRGKSALQIARGRCTAKFLLKHHYRPLLPEAITSKKKQGGFAPMPVFFSDKAQRDRLGEFIMESAVTREFLKRDAVERFIAAYDAEARQTGRWFWYRQNRAIQYFNLLTLSVWWELYVKGNRSVRL